MPKHVTETTGASIESTFEFETGAKIEMDTGTSVEFKTGSQLTIAGTFRMTGDYVQIDEGGTGATTAAIALNNLGVNPLSVARGGTNATNAGDARSQLGAASQGNNSDITQLSGLSTPTEYGIMYRSGADLTATAAATSPYQEVYSGSSGEPTWREKTEVIEIVVKEPSSSLAATSNAAHWFFPFAGFVKEVHAGVSTPSSTRDIELDVMVNTTSLFSTKLYIDTDEQTSATASTTAVIAAGTSNFDKWDRGVIEIDRTGTTAEGLIVTLVCVKGE